MAHIELDSFEPGRTLNTTGGEILQRDEEIQRMDAVLAQFKERRNDLLPLFRLPTEILTEILYLCLYNQLGEYSSPVAPALASLWEVSRRMRALIMGCRRLWTLIDFDSSGAAEKMLRMAGFIPLVLRVRTFTHLDADDSYFEEGIFSQRYRALESVLGDVQRFQELHVCLIKRELIGIYATMDKARPMTIPLRSLRIECDTDESPPFSKCLENCLAPALSEVKIIGRPPTLGCPLLGKSLKYLELHGTQPHQASLKAILDGLRNLPNLHTLILQHYFPPLSTPESEAVGRVHLPRLTLFRLEDDITNCALLLKHMKLDYPTQITVICHADLMQESLLHPFLASVSRNGEEDWIGTLHLMGHTREYISQLQAWQSNSPLDFDAISQSGFESEDPGPPLLVEFMYRHPHEDGDIGAAGELCAGMRLGSLHTLNVYNCEGWSDAAWRRVFQQCTKLTNLTVSGVDLPTFIQVLSIGIDGQFMISGLETLALNCSGTRYKTFSEKMCSMLKDRRDHKVPLQELRLLRCPGLNEDDRLSLDELVPKVHCDVGIHGRSIWDIIAGKPREAFRKDPFSDEDSEGDFPDLYSEGDSMSRRGLSNFI